MPTKKHIAASSWVDPDDAPTLNREWFDRAEIREGDHLLRAARPVANPTKAESKEIVRLRLDSEIVAYFRATGRGWQSRINAALRKAAGL